MEKPKIYVFRQSALMPPGDELQTEISEACQDFSNLLTKCEGHYLALEEIQDKLSDLLDRCNFNLQSIEIVGDNEQPIDPPRAIGLTDLSRREKELIVSNAMAVTVAVEVIAGLFDCSFLEAAQQVRTLSKAKYYSASNDDVNKLVEDMARSVREHPEGGVFVTTTLDQTPEN